jgi:hypothetical protein
LSFQFWVAYRLINSLPFQSNRLSLIFFHTTMDLVHKKQFLTTGVLFPFSSFPWRCLMGSFSAFGQEVLLLVQSQSHPIIDFSSSLPKLPPVAEDWNSNYSPRRRLVDRWDSKLMSIAINSRSCLEGFIATSQTIGCVRGWESCSSSWISSSSLNSNVG